MSNGAYTPVGELPGILKSRLLVAALAALVAVPWTAYLVQTIVGARARRTEIAESRNLETARFSARLLTEQCGSAIGELKALARQPAVVAGLHGTGRQAAAQRLAQAVRGSTNLVFVGLYGQDGGWAAGYPTNVAPSRRERSEPWFRSARTQNGVFASGVLPPRGRNLGRFVALAVPVPGPAPRRSRPDGCLLGYYAFGEVDAWLRDTNVETGVRIDIVSRDGRLVASNGRARAPSPQEARGLLQKAGPAAYGSQGPRPGKGGDLLLAHARIKDPAWTVIVTQPEEDALDVTNRFMLRMVFLYMVVVALIAWGAWALVRTYHRQEELARRMEEQNVQLLQKDEAKSTFLANVSHDLWTPLASLRFAISSLLDTDVPWTHLQVRESLLMANTELDKVNARVRNLLEMSRLESHTDSTAPQPCDLETLVRAVLERARLLLEERPVEMDFPARPLMFKCRHAQMEVVLLNMLENAVKYSPPGTPLRLHGEAQDHHVLLTLRDKGPGVDPKDNPRIFEKFYRAQPDHPQGGTGLGLAICKAIIEEHGGRIGATNVPGWGAEFWFSLPAHGAAKDRSRWLSRSAYS